MKRLLLAILIVLLGVAVVARLMWPRLTDVARQRAEKVVSEVLGRRSRIEQLSISLLPPRIQLSGVTLGTPPTSMAKAGAIDIRLWVLASLSELRPVVSVRLDSISADLQQLPQPRAGLSQAQHRRGDLPSLRVRQLQLEQTQVSFRLGEAAVTLEMAQATGTLDSRSQTHLVKATVDVTGVQLERTDRRLKLAEIHFAGGADRGELFITAASMTGEGVNVSLGPAAAAHEYRLAAAIDLDRIGSLLGESMKGELRVDGTTSGNLTKPTLQAQVTIANLTVNERAIGAVKAKVATEAQAVRLADLDVTGPLGNAAGTVRVTTSDNLPIAGTLDLRGVDLDTVLRALGRPEEIGNEVSGTVSISGTLDPLDVTLKASGALRRSIQPEAMGPRTPARADPPEPTPIAEPAGDETALPTNAEAHEGQETEAKGGAGGAESPGAQETKSRPEIATFNLDAHIERGGATAEVEIQQPQQNNSLTVNVSSKNKQLAGPVHLQVHDLAALSQLMPKSIRDLAMTGQVEGSVTLSGTAAQPKIQGSVVGREMSVMGVTVPQVAGDFVIENSTLSTPSFKILTATGSVQFNGTVALGSTEKNDWRLDIRALDTDLVVGLIHAVTRSALPVSGGTVNGSVQARGPWQRVALDATVSASSVYVEREVIERMDIKLEAELPRWTLHTSLVHAASEVLTIDGSGTGAGPLQLTINSTPLQLANFRGATQRNLTGGIVVHGEISGSLREPEGTLQVAASDVALEGRRWGDMTLRASGRQGEWSMTAAAFEDALNVDATLRLTSAYPYTLKVQLRGVQFGSLISSDESLQAVISADVDLKGSAKALANPSGAVRVNQLDISRGQYRVTAAEPIRIDVTDGRFFIRSMVLAAPNSRLSVDGELATSGDVNLRAQGEGNLVLLELIGRPVSSARGEFTVAMQIQRRPESGWNLSGQGEVRDTTLDLGLPVAFTGVNGNFALAGSSVRIESLDGKAGGGQFHVGGSVSLDQGPDLTWKIQEISVSSGQGLEAEVSGAGRVQGTWKVIAVTGDAEIISALYDRNIELTDFLPFFREQIRPVPRTKPPAIEVRLNLHVHAPGGLYIDNNVAKVELSANLYIDGTAEKPQVTGTIDFLTGEVTFRKRTFNIVGGSVDFRDHGRINPILNISAESQISTADADYTVTVTVTGTADDPHVEVSADDPTLTETDMLSLITFGQTTAQLQRQGGGISPIDALALLPTGTITAPVAKLIGVNRMEIEAVQSPSTGSAGGIQPRLTLGKDLTDRLRASVSTAFGLSTEQMAQLEYRVTPRISLLGSWEGQTTGQAGAFGGDIKFRYEFRRIPFSLLPGGLEPTAGDNAR